MVRLQYADRDIQCAVDIAFQRVALCQDLLATLELFLAQAQQQLSDNLFLGLEVVVRVRQRHTGRWAMTRMLASR